MMTADEAKALRAYFEANRVIVGQQEEITGTIISTYLGVALWGHEGGPEEPLTITELANRIGLPTPTVSRHLRYLGDRLRRNVPGMGVVRTHIYPENRRQKVVSLTAKGRALRDRVLYALGASSRAE